MIRTAMVWWGGAALAVIAATAGVATAAAEGEQAGGLPSFFDIKRYDLGIYTLVVFGLLYAIIRYLAWPMIQEGLQKREEGIRQAHAEAERLRTEAAKKTDERALVLAKAHEEARLIVAEARRDAQQYKEEEKARAAAEIQADRDRLRREIEAARDQALKEVWVQAVELATQVSTRALADGLPTDVHRRLVEKALTDLRHEVGQA